MEIIVTSEEKLEKIISKCLLNIQPTINQEIKREEPLYLRSIKELANFLNCSTTTAQKIKNSGKIRYSQIGRKVIFIAEQVLEDIKKSG